MSDNVIIVTVRHAPRSISRDRRVAFTVGQSVCFCEKRSTRSAKHGRTSPHRAATPADLKPGVEYTSLHSSLKIPYRSRRAFSNCSFIERRHYCSSGSPCVKHWWKGAATLQMRAFCTIGTASKPPASQAFKPAPYCPPVHVLMVGSAPVNRVQSESICGPILSMSIGLQRLSSMHPCGLGII